MHAIESMQIHVCACRRLRTHKHTRTHAHMHTRTHVRSHALEHTQKPRIHVKPLAMKTNKVTGVLLSLYHSRRVVISSCFLFNWRIASVVSREVPDVPPAHWIPGSLDPRLGSIGPPAHWSPNGSNSVCHRPMSRE